MNSDCQISRTRALMFLCRISSDEGTNETRDNLHSLLCITHQVLKWYVDKPNYHYTS